MSRFEEKRLARWISAGFHPFVWVTLAFLGVLWRERTLIGPGRAVELGVLYVVLAAGLPLTVLYLLHKTRLSADVYLSKPKERRRFVGVEMAMIVPALVVVGYAATLSRVALFYLAVLVANLIVYIGLLRWVKMSVHIGVLTAIGWSLVLLVGWSSVLFFGLLAPVGWARWKLGQHTWWELMWGVVSVSVVTVGAWMIIMWV